MRWLVPRVIVIGATMVLVNRIPVDPVWLLFVAMAGILAFALGSLTILDRLVPMPPARRRLSTAAMWALLAVSFVTTPLVPHSAGAAAFVCLMALLMVATRADFRARG